MWVFFLEAGVALGLVVLILWWTMAPVKRREDRHEAALKPQTTHRQAAEDERSP